MSRGKPTLSVSPLQVGTGSNSTPATRGAHRNHFGLTAQLPCWLDAQMPAAVRATQTPETTARPRDRLSEDTSNHHEAWTHPVKVSQAGFPSSPNDVLRFGGLCPGWGAPRMRVLSPDWGPPYEGGT